MAPVHLVVLIHGLYGNPGNLAVPAEELLLAATCERVAVRNEQSSSDEAADVDEGSARASARTSSSYSATTAPTPPRPELVVYICKTFSGPRTWDGVDTNALRAWREVQGEVRRLEGEGRRVGWFSLMGYSLGGLVARHLVGLIHFREPDFFRRHLPCSFSTVSTPHIGVLKYGSRLNTVIHTVGRRLFSRSGQQMYCLDRAERGRCLLEVMADPAEIYVEALKRFTKIMIVANGCNDLTVPFPTAAISKHDPFADHETTDLHVEVDERHVVQSFQRRRSGPGADSPGESSSSDGKTAADAAETNRAQEDEEVTITVTVQRTGSKRRPPRFPPFLFLPWPFTYLMFFIFPFLLPVILVIVTTTFTLHTFQSSRRLGLHSVEAENSERKPLVDQSADLRYTLDIQSIPHLSDLIDPTSQSGSVIARSGTATPVLPLSDDHPPTRIPLLLTPRQANMIDNLNAALPQMERIVSWFPWVFNTHGMSIVRDPKRFPYFEEGRGVVKTWAEWVVDSA